MIGMAGNSADDGRLADSASRPLALIGAGRGCEEGGHTAVDIHPGGGLLGCCF